MSDNEEIFYDSKFDINCVDTLQKQDEPIDTAAPVFPAEISSIIHERTKILVRQNEELRSDLSEAADEIERLQQKSDQLTEQLSRRGPSTDQPQFVSEFASTKLIELSKKNRNLTAELEATKMRCAALQSKLEQAQNMPTTTETVTTSEDETSRASEANLLQDAQAEVSSLREQLSSSKQRTFEARNQIQTLRTELKQAQRLLQQELGDSQSVGALSTGWRGRAQQIIALQNKVAELQQKSGHSIATEQSSQVALRQMEAQRRQTQQNVANELAAARVELDAKEKKLSALKARCGALQSDNEARNKRVDSLLEKTHNDDQLMKALKYAQSQTMRKHELELHEKEAQQEQLKNKISDLELEISKWKIRCEEEPCQAQEKASSIEKLNIEVHTFEDADDGHVFSKDYYRSLVHASELEKTKLAELLSAVQSRLDEEILKSLKEHRSFLTERKRCGQLRAQVDLLEQEYKKLRKRQPTYRASMSRSQSTSSGAPNTPGSGADSNAANPSGLTTLQIEDIRNKLELAEENLLALSERLDSVMRYRKEDMAQIKSMIQETRETFRKSSMQDSPDRTDNARLTQQTSLA